MKDIVGNANALKAHKRASQRQTRKNLELALARLRNGNPRRVKKGTLITVASVAEEAGIERSTLYRYHEPVLTEIRKLNSTVPQKQLHVKRGELAEAIAKLREYRDALEQARAEIIAWARQNYALSHRLQELEANIRQRDTTIAELQDKLRTAMKTTPLITITKPTDKTAR